MSAEAAFGMLQGVRVLEIASIGPGPFCAMMLADHGADVLRIERDGERTSGLPIGDFDFLLRGRPALVLDLKSSAGREECLRLVAKADILIEGFRPGVMERLGLGPADCQQRNPRLVYGRITGWGQDGPLAQSAGHDINYIAMTGGLNAIGERGGPPTVPLNLVGDYGGGAMLLAFGILAALHESNRTGIGRVVDAAIADGVASQLSLMRALRNAGFWTLQRGGNPLDGGAPYYAVYKTADDRYLAAGPIEERFWTIFADRLGLDVELRALRDERKSWPALKAKIAALIAARPLAHWVEHFAGLDACVAPVLNFDEAVTMPHALARQSYTSAPGGFQPTPAPRLTEEELRDWQEHVNDPAALQQQLARWINN